MVEIRITLTKPQHDTPRLDVLYKIALFCRKAADLSSSILAKWYLKSEQFRSAISAWKSHDEFRDEHLLSLFQVL